MRDILAFRAKQTTADPVKDALVRKLLDLIDKIDSGDLLDILKNLTNSEKKTNNKGVTNEQPPLP